MINDFLYDGETILPINDLMFKRIFWNKEHPNILISFINAVLKRKDPITSVELISTEMDDEFIGEHGIRLDLIAKTSTDELLNIEMQKKNDDDMYKRSLYYWSKLYASQLKKGQKYSELHPVIAINIIDFTLFKDEQCHRNFVLKNAKTNEEWLRMLEIHFVELKKRQYMDQNDDLWAWAEFLKVPNSETLSEKKEEIQPIVDAKRIFDTAVADPKERDKMRLLEKTQRDNLSAINESELNRVKKEGLAEGESKKAIETAKNLITMNLSVEQIAVATGLTVEEVKTLIDSNNRNS